jgi:hypothetical protein
MLLLFLGGAVCIALWLGHRPASAPAQGAVPDRAGSASAPAPAEAQPRHEGEAPAAVPADGGSRLAQSQPADTARVPAAPAPEPPAPLPGASLSAVFGGTEAIAAFHRSTPPEQRKVRLLELDSGLAEYSGDPADPKEFEKYQALKDEAEWLRTHPDN